MTGNRALGAAGAFVLVGLSLAGCDDDPTAATSSGSTTGTTSQGAGGAGGGEGVGGSGGSGGDAAASADAMIMAHSGSTVTGTAVFTQAAGQVTLVVNVEGAMPGVHAVHIHDMGDCATDGMAAGGHWNPTTKMHGEWGMGDFHLGDIGNMTVEQDGKGTITLTTNLWTIGTGKTDDVVGHAIMVHANPDDFMTQPTGNAGAREGCGVIALTK